MTAKLKLEQVRRWVRENDRNGGTPFEDQFRGLRKILGMPTSESGDRHKATKIRSSPLPDVDLYRFAQGLCHQRLERSF